MFRKTILSFITNNAKGILSYKLIQYLKEKIGQLEYYFYKKLTLAVKLNKNGKSILRVMFYFPTKKKNSCGVLTAYFGKETFNVKKQETDKR